MTYIQRAQELAQQEGAHHVHTNTVTRVPRVYRAWCSDCPWQSGDGTGAQIAQAALAHAQATKWTLAGPPSASPLNASPEVIPTVSPVEAVVDTMERIVEIPVDVPPAPDPIADPDDYPEEYQKLIPAYGVYESYVPRVLNGSGKTDFEAVKAAALAGENILLISDKGAGKNHLADSLAAYLKIPRICISNSADAQVEDIIGQMVFAGSNAGTVWVDGFFTDFFRLAGTGKRCMIILDEVNALKPGLTFRLHNAMDDRARELVLAEKGREVLKDPAFKLIIVGTMNPNYRGTHSMNAAFKRRWGYKLPLDYNEVVEKKLLKAAGLDTRDIGRLLDFAKGVRTMYQLGQITETVGTADLLKYAKNLKTVGPELARLSLVNSFEPDEQVAVVEAMKLNIDNATSKASEVKL